MDWTILNFGLAVAINAVLAVIMWQVMGARRAMVWVLAIVLVLAVAVGCGAPVINGSGLSWDNSGWINAQNQKTQRERIQANRDVRVAEEWNGTMQIVGTTALQIGAVCVGLWAAAKTLPAIFGSLATMFAAWAARPHRPVAQPPPVIVMMAAPELAAAPEARLELSKDEGWVIVNPRTQTVKLLEDHTRRRA